MATKENVLEIIDLIGNSKAMQEVQQLIEKASQCKANVLITGESGTGKTVVANEIHNRSAFKQGPFVVVNCGTIPYSLIESELFGYERGSFTGAFSRSKGKFEQAQNGTIFLDEIGELPKDAQVKLLGVLQSKKIIRVGGDQTIQLNLRVITATNRNLWENVEKGKYRADLFYRIALFLIDLPNLAERKEDIVPLANHFIRKYSELENRPIMTLSDDAKEDLENHSWAGNVRQLENNIYRTIIMNSDKEELRANDIMHLEHKYHYNKVIKSNKHLLSGDIIPLEELECMMIRKAILETRGNIQKTAILLRVARGTLYRKIKKYSLELLVKDPSEEVL